MSRIVRNPYQPRETFNDDKFQELVSSVRVHGVLQPIVVRSKGSDQYELVAGERRLRAAIAAGLSRIPAVIRELTNEQSLQVALVENIQREDINASMRLWPTSGWRRSSAFRRRSCRLHWGRAGLAWPIRFVCSICLMR